MAEPSYPKKRTTIYIESNLLTAFKKICKREGESMSQKMEKYAARYVSVHGKGNPQLCLERFIEPAKYQCFRCEGQFATLFKVKFISGLTANVCRECLEVYKKQTTVKHVLGEVGKKEGMS